MFGSIREFLNKSPWLGWVLAGILLAVSIFMLVKGQGGTDPYNPDRMRESVTIRFTDTNDEITMTRGQMDKELRRKGVKLDVSEGITNPKTGKPTGFLFNKTEWDEMIARINQEKEDAKRNKGAIVPAGKAPPVQDK